MLSESDIAQRLPVWRAFSELFLDTELAPEDYQRIASALTASSYSADALLVILEDEVAPAFHANLMTVAGEWSGWSDEAVVATVSRVIDRSGRLDIGLSLRKMFARAYVRTEWAKLAPML